jgi:hypothetical protein
MVIFLSQFRIFHNVEWKYIVRFEVFMGVIMKNAQLVHLPALCLDYIQPY